MAAWRHIFALEARAKMGQNMGPICGGLGWGGVLRVYLQSEVNSTGQGVFPAHLQASHI
jgi:hypothetical protein